MADKFWAVDEGEWRLVEGTIQKKLKPGLYELTVRESMMGPPMLTLAEMKPRTDKLLPLPDSLCEYIVGSIEKFWKNEKKYLAMGLVHKRGLLLEGAPGTGKCLAPGTLVLMFNGTVKKVEHVKVGDLLMGPDSNPRRVLSLAHGWDEMYDIIPVKGDTYRVNKPHILSLQMSGKRHKDKIVDVAVEEYLNWNPWRKSRAKGYRVGVDFPTQPVPIDPYFIGLWLGDGNSWKTNISSEDYEIKQYLQTLAESHGLQVTDVKVGAGKCSEYAVSTGHRGLLEDGTYPINPVYNALRELELIRNKHVPQLYKTNDRENRLALLAGYLDADGYWDEKGKGYDIVSISAALMDDMVFVARSLGFAAYSKPCIKSDQNGTEGTYYRAFISGNLEEIPVKLPRRLPTKRGQIKDILRTGITVKSAGMGEYFGFMLEGDGRFLLGDFTVTHNTAICLLVGREIGNRGGVAVFTSPKTNIAALPGVLKMIRDVHPEMPIINIMEDIDRHKRQLDAILPMLDGENQVSNIVHIATTNYRDKLDARLVNRPSRFDEVIKVKPPMQKAREAYLRSVFPDGDISTDRLKEVVKHAKGLNFAHLKELAVATYVYEIDPAKTAAKLKALAENRPVGFREDDEED